MSKRFSQGLYPFTPLDGQSSTPATPAAGTYRLFVDTDGLLKWVDDAGAVVVAASEAYVDSVASEVTAVEESTTSRTLQLSDAGKMIEATHADPSTVTVPPSSSVAFPVGTLVGVYSAGAGGVTIAEGTGVTVRNLSAVDQYGEASLRYRGSDEWVQA